MTPAIGDGMRLYILPLGACVLGASLFYGLSDDRSAPTACDAAKVVSTSVRLQQNCIYTAPFSIRSSGITLDCAGATIDASSSKVGILIQGPSIHDVTVRNCNIEGAKNEGIRIRPLLDPNEIDELSVAERYSISAKRVSIENSKVNGSGNVGVYVGRYSQRTKIVSTTVTRSGGPAVYLDASSIKTRIERSTFSGNGFGGQTRSTKRNREALAVDSSSHNIINNNVFRGNAAGGVFLYKNCWERHNDPSQTPRWMHSSSNIIRGNYFEETIGVWVASRQSKDQTNMDCGDQQLAPGYYRDYAENNTVVANVFSGGRIGVDIQDDFATVTANTFSGQEEGCVVLGAKLRDRLLGEPIKQTSLVSNECNSTPSSGYIIKGKSRFWTCNGNSLNGTYFLCKQS